MGEEAKISEFEALQQAMKSDPEYAWTWLCNIAVPLMDSLGISHEQANVTGAYLMSHLFGVDITSHEQFRYGKGIQQRVHEHMMAEDGR